MRVEVYEEISGNGSGEITAVVAKENKAMDRNHVCYIDGTDWDDCMSQLHEKMNWEPYKPSIKKPSDEVLIWYTLRKKGEAQNIAVESFVSRLSNLTPPQRR